MKILAIETSCDDTCAAVLENDRVLSSVISSQTDLHLEWGGVVPDIAKRAHAERIKPVIIQALRNAKLGISNPPRPPFDKGGVELYLEKVFKKIDVIAVTKGPGLAIALSIGVNTAKELAIKYNKKLVAVNHVEGHLLSNLVKNSKGLPIRNIKWPAMALTVSGGHTKLILVKENQQFEILNLKFENEKQLQNLPPTPSLIKEGEEKIIKLNNPYFSYEVVGETLDDAAGEALDKAAKLLGLGYPGGPVIERIAEKVGQTQGMVNGQTHRSALTTLKMPHPLADKKILDFSFSGLKTSFYYQIKDWPKEKINENMAELAAIFQEAVFEHLIRKFKLAIEKYQPKSLLAAGGVLANMTLRKKLRKLARELKLPIFMPDKKWLNTDNAAMIGRAGWEMAKRGQWADPLTLDRNPRLNF